MGGIEEAHNGPWLRSSREDVEFFSEGLGQSRDRGLEGRRQTVKASRTVWAGAHSRAQKSQNRLASYALNEESRKKKMKHTSTNENTSYMMPMQNVFVPGNVRALRIQGKESRAAVGSSSAQRQQRRKTTAPAGGDVAADEYYPTSPGSSENKQLKKKNYGSVLHSVDKFKTLMFY